MLRNVVLIAVVALLVAAVTATAQGLITGAQIKNATVTGADLKNGSVQVNDLSRNARNALRGARGPRGRQGLLGAQGAAGLSGPAGATGRNGVTDISYVDGPIVFVAPGGAEVASVTCPADRIATGGSEGNSSSGLLDIENLFVGPSGVAIIGVNNISASAEPLQARAMCAKF